MKKVYFEDIKNLDEVIDMCLDKSYGRTDKSWKEITRDLKLEMKPEALSRFAKYIVIYREHLIKHGDTENIEILQELKKEKMKVADQRRELNRTIRESARMENIIETFEQHLNNRERVTFFSERKMAFTPNPNKEAVVFISDVHYGIGIDNELNKYNAEICKDSFNQLYEDTINVLELHKVKDLTVVLGGDLVSGIIHTNLRLQQVEDVITQILAAADIIEEFCCKLRDYGFNVRIVGTIGNHSRVIADKKQNLSDENFERIIFKQLSKAGFEVMQDSDVAIFYVAGNPVAVLHGDQTSPDTAFTYVIKRKGIIPKNILMAHLHSDTRVDKGCPVIINGSMVGVDEYALEKGYNSVPHQKIIIFQEDIGEIDTFKSIFNNRK